MGRDNDINIHVKAKGTQKTQSDLNKTARAAKGVGNQAAKGQDRAASATDKADKKLSKQAKTFDSLKGKVLGYIAAAVGVEQLIRLFSRFLEKLQQIQQIQNEIYNQSIPDLGLGQILVGQTGQGKQEMWAKHILELQEAGGLSSAKDAQQMMVAGDIAFGPWGGISSRPIREMLKELAPMFGDASMGGDEISKFFEFAKGAGVAMDTASYKDFFAKMKAGATASNAETFGDFVLGMQKGALDHLNETGSLEEGIALYTAVRSITASEDLAATALKQLTRLAAGSNAKFTKSVEDSQRVDFGRMTQDDRTAAVLQYVNSLPPQQRTALLVEAGVPEGVVGVFTGMASRRAQGVLAATRETVSAADAADVDESAEKWIDSTLAKSNIAEARRGLSIVKTGPAFASWSERKKTAETDHKILVAKGKDSKMIPDEAEPGIMALESLLKEFDRLVESAPESEKASIRIIRDELARKVIHAKAQPGGVNAVGGIDRMGQEFEQDLKTMQRAAEITAEQEQQSQGASMFGDPFGGQPQNGQGGNTINNFDYSNHNYTNFYPSAGDDLRGPRAPRDLR